MIKKIIALAKQIKPSSFQFEYFLSPAEIKQLTQAFGFKKPVTSFLVPGGCGPRSSFLPSFKIDGKQFIMKEIKYSRTKEEIEYCIELMTFMKHKGIPIPCVPKLSAKNDPKLQDFYVRFQGHTFTLDKWIEAKDISLEKAPKEVMEKIGSLMATMHNYSEEFDKSRHNFRGSHVERLHPYTILNKLTELHQYQDILGSDYHYIQKKLIEVLQIDCAPLKKFHTHADSNIGNLKFDKDNNIAAVLDWEMCVFTHRIVDIFHGALVTGKVGSYYMDEKMISNKLAPLIKGYNSVSKHPISKAELAQFPLYAKLRFLEKILLYFKKGFFKRSLDRIPFIKQLDKLFETKEWDDLLASLK